MIDKHLKIRNEAQDTNKTRYMYKHIVKHAYINLNSSPFFVSHQQRGEDKQTNKHIVNQNFDTN